MAAATKNGETKEEVVVQTIVTIPRLHQARAAFTILGTSPYMQLRFSEKAMNKMQVQQAAGQQARSRRTREARDFDDDYLQAMHRFANGDYGIPAAAFRNAMISACRVVGFKMTIAKLSIFVEQDGLDVVDGTPLVILHGDPEPTRMAVRNATGVADLRIRPMWREWHLSLRLRWDAAQFSHMDIVNLLYRAGQQVGVGEGRPDSRESAGLGYGLFTIGELEDENREEATHA